MSSVAAETVVSAILFSPVGVLSMTRHLLAEIVDFNVFMSARQLFLFASLDVVDEIHAALRVQVFLEACCRYSVSSWLRKQK